ncbi:hypothetical protein, partial [Pseudomonas tumuqii]|uniref:hypothetical protein n=1 Tax=Pseudomonas tumuqii TaxID=2715755 RepID=UPI001C499EF5
GLLALACVLGVGEGHLLHRKTQRVESGYFAKIRKSSSEFPWVFLSIGILILPISIFFLRKARSI